MEHWRFLSGAGSGPITLRSRRTFLQAGLGGALSLGAAPLLLASSEASQAPKRTDAACIFVFLDGGPPQHETFDPKPDAPAQVRGEFGAISTSLPGISISEKLPHLASQAQHFALLRSIFHENPSHAPAEHQMLTGWMGSREGTSRAVIETPSFGSIVSRLCGSRQPGLPPYVAIPWSFHHAYVGSPFGGAAYLGAEYEPFESGNLPKSAQDGFQVPALELRDALPVGRLSVRRDLLTQLDRFRRDAVEVPLSRSRAFTTAAMDLLLDDRVRAAFDLTREPAALRAEYGAHEWGQGALLARRLVEAGTTFVLMQCGLRQDWDTHKDNFGKLKQDLLPPLDSALAALIRDLADRGLHERTLVLVTGEFGRTPLINKDAGRDHWSTVFSVLASGGGTVGGQVIGASDHDGANPADRPLHAQDLFATMYHALGVDYHTVFHDPLGRPISVLGHGTPIAELL